MNSRCIIKVVFLCYMSLHCNNDQMSLKAFHYGCWKFRKLLRMSSLLLSTSDNGRASDTTSRHGVQHPAHLGERSGVVCRSAYGCPGANAWPGRHRLGPRMATSDSFPLWRPNAGNGGFGISRGVAPKMQDWNPVMNAITGPAIIIPTFCCNASRGLPSVNLKWKIASV